MPARLNVVESSQTAVSSHSETHIELKQLPAALTQLPFVQRLQNNSGAKDKPGDESSARKKEAVAPNLQVFSNRFAFSFKPSSGDVRDFYGTLTHFSDARA